MKTVAFNGNKNFARAFFVLAALGGLYYMRRSGKSASDILALGTDGVKKASGLISRFAPPVTAAEAVSSAAQI